MPTLCWMKVGDKQQKLVMLETLKLKRDKNGHQNVQNYACEHIRMWKLHSTHIKYDLMPIHCKATFIFPEFPSIGTCETN